MTYTSSEGAGDVLQAVMDAYRDALKGNEEEITKGTDFFDAGGNSVWAARIIARLRNTLGAPISINDLFRARTPEGLASICIDHIRSNQSVSETSEQS